jgi:hypothetical protein
MLRSAFPLFFVILTFSSCNKLLDYYNYKNGNAPSTGCQVKTMTFASGTETYTTSISYSSNSAPTNVKYETYNSEFDYTDSFTFHYTYDELNRLVSGTSDYAYGPDFVYYEYDGNSALPVRDTVRALYMSYVEDLEYDTKGRLIKITRRDFQYVIPQDDPSKQTVEVYKYYYDLRGNRQEDMSNIGYPGLIQYSDKPSLYSLHPVWQLIHKDYSKNSVPFGETYNDKDLPLSISENVRQYIQPFLNLTHGSSIDYVCTD